MTGRLEPRDRIDLLRCYGVHVRLSDDRQYLRVSGPPDVLHLAKPSLRYFKAALLAHLQRHPTPAPNLENVSDAT
jgi:hypothetical protein